MIMRSGLYNSNKYISNIILVFLTIFLLTKQSLRVNLIIVNMTKLKNKSIIVFNTVRFRQNRSQRSVLKGGTKWAEDIGEERILQLIREYEEEPYAGTDISTPRKCAVHRICIRPGCWIRS